MGIGASAGGLHVLETFFDHLPDLDGVAFVVIVHLAPGSDLEITGGRLHVKERPHSCGSPAPLVQRRLNRVDPTPPRSSSPYHNTD